MNLIMKLNLARTIIYDGEKRSLTLIFQVQRLPVIIQRGYGMLVREILFHPQVHLFS